MPLSLYLLSPIADVTSASQPSASMSSGAPIRCVGVIRQLLGLFFPRALLRLSPLRALFFSSLFTDADTTSRDLCMRACSSYFRRRDTGRPDRASGPEKLGGRLLRPFPLERLLAHSGARNLPAGIRGAYQCCCECSRLVLSLVWPLMYVASRCRLNQIGTRRSARTR